MDKHEKVTKTCFSQIPKDVETISLFLSDNSYASRGRAHKRVSRDIKENVSIRTGRPLTYRSCKWFNFPEGRHPAVFNLDSQTHWLPKEFVSAERKC